METRSDKKRKQLVDDLKDRKSEHLGFDVSKTVKTAMDNGGKLEEESRRKMKGDIARNKYFAPDLQKILGPDLANHIHEHRKSGFTVMQDDKRVDPQKGGSYQGYMFSSTRVLNSTFDSQLKEIGEPRSPNPYSGTGESHRAHTTPFNLAGVETNSTRTVNAFSWANITVDSFIESKAKASVAKYDEGNVFHFRLDTHDRSSVGYAVDRGEDLDDKRWKVVVAQYQRK